MRDIPTLVRSFLMNNYTHYNLRTLYDNRQILTQIEDLLKSNNIELIKIISSTNRPSTQKLRIIADGHQVMRVDNEKTDDISISNS